LIEIDLMDGVCPSEADEMDDFEREDAPEELAITLGVNTPEAPATFCDCRLGCPPDDICPDYPDDWPSREPLSVRLDSAFKPYKGFMGR
jgi:hypothetical protein